MASNKEQQENRERNEGGTATATSGRRSTGTEVATRQQGELDRPAHRGPALMRWPGFLAEGMPASPWELVRRMSDEIDQLWESFGGRRRGMFAPTFTGTGTGFGLETLVPQIEVVQRKDALVVRADLPGLKPEDVNVSVENGVLTISGERRHESTEEQEGYVRSERVYGTFYRAIPLPDGADEDKVDARFTNGVLEVTVPVTARERGRKIKIRT